MVAPRYRSRTFRRVFVKTPGGQVVLHYKKRKPAQAQCAKCSSLLSGVPRVRARELQHMAKTAKRPQRPFGGQLCSSCMRQVIVDSVRKA
ncbi:MAG: 50S ribosomal protein L34e [Candidatus Aenigmarchaeota archaeon]|nr:50S ribosomal protein L34e [Candidatus Aenigmarchaeota archaeon]